MPSPHNKVLENQRGGGKPVDWAAFGIPNGAIGSTTSPPGKRIFCFCDLTLTFFMRTPSPQKLHIRKDYIQTKNFGKKKLSNRRAFMGELTVKMGHF